MAIELPPPFYAAGEHIGIDLPGAGVAFTTRRGGCSTGPYTSLNLGRLTNDDREAVRRNRASVRDQLGVRLAFARQVHGTTVARIGAPIEETSAPREADGLVATARGIGVMVLTADCLPIAIGAPGVTAIVHAGWRGLAGGIVAEAVRAARELADGSPLAAAIGPGAGGCCYEVGAGVHAVFAAYGEAGRRGRNLDLKAIARLELEDAGVDQIHDVQLCTICADPSLFYSHRRDRGVTGRQAGVAWLS